MSQGERDRLVRIPSDGVDPNVRSRASFVDAAVALVVLAAVLVVACATPQTEPAHGDPALEPVSYENLYERELYWPPNVLMTDIWKPEGFEGDRIYGSGTLIRVEPSGELWLRFPQRFGTRRVPARVTNVIDEANRIRRGEVRKALPNFVMMAANKLVLPGNRGSVNPFGVKGVEQYLLVSADPMSEAFAEIASALEPIVARGDVLVVLFPQGAHDNDDVLARCEEVGWASPFLYSLYVRGFTAAYFGDDMEPPSLILQTPNGRRIHQTGWREDALAGLTEAVELNLPPKAPDSA